MPLTKVFTHFLRNGEETREKHPDPTLRTQTYRKSKRDMMAAVQQVVKNKLAGWQIVHIEEEHGELSVVAKSGVSTSDIVITVFSITPLRSSVDVASSRRGNLGDFGTSYSNIVRFFRALNREVPPES